MEVFHDKRLNMDSSAYLEWFNTALPIERKIWERLTELCDLMDDMLFGEGTASYELIKCAVESVPSSGNYVEDKHALPNQLSYFSMSWFTVKLENMDPPYLACYNHLKQQFCISPAVVENDAVLLHELLHMFEDIVNELPLFYHDMLYWSLYCDLREKIVGLDIAIQRHASLYTQSTLYYYGGSHDVLFLLKSLDLDIRKGYDFGTVFGYDHAKYFTYLKHKK